MTQSLHEPEVTSPEALRELLADRSVTLVLGAGVSRSRGVPTWTQLTRALWSQSGLDVPSWLEDHSAELAEVQEFARSRLGPDLASRLAVQRPHPLAEQMALELLERVFDERAKGSGEPGFAERLRRALYPNGSTKTGANTLSVLVRLLRDEQRAPCRRIARVVSFNADDHLEVEANGGHSPLEDPVLWPVVRESSHLRFTHGAHGLAPIPVYHPHGFLPRHPQHAYEEAADALVFTDAQYWASVANPLSFANRVIVNALHDSICLFIGLSMFDVNLMRWLGLRYAAVCADQKSRFECQGNGNGDHQERLRSQRAALERHFWVRLASDDPDRLVTAILKERGVSSVEIESWGAPFENLLETCFPRPPDAAAL